jgi:hypothetical protein
MGLDLGQVVPQIDEMASRLKSGRKEAEGRLGLALKTLQYHQGAWQGLGEKCQSARTTWLVAGLVEGLGEGYPLPSLPSEFSVLGVDGSHIALDRHMPVRCYLINGGLARLHYGGEPSAGLVRRARLFSREEDLVVSDPSGLRAEPVEGALLAARRWLEEVAFLAEALKEEGPFPALGLLDGSLVLWGLTGQACPDFVRQVLLDRGLVPILDRIEGMARKGPLALASYISLPRSTEVVNALRVALCPYSPPDCDRHCRGKKDRECSGVSGVEDRALFASLLKVGERSPLFLTRSSVVEHYGRHQVFFFYLKGEEEMARVEVPSWVAERKELVDLAHALVFDQVRRGGGYPVALTEAHELAVVSAQDREAFWSLVGEVVGYLPSAASQKSQSKRTRWL